MIHYLKFFLTPAIATFGIAGLFLGGSYMWVGIAFLFVVVILGDFVLGDDPIKRDFKNVELLNIPLFFALPFLTLYLSCLAWTISPYDFLNLGSFFEVLTGYNANLAKQNNQLAHYVGALLSVGFTVAAYGTNVAHELFHRTHKKFDFAVGKWLMSMSMNSDFVIEHVWGHHVRVSTEHDHGSAKKGQYLYPFVLKSTIGSFFSAWELEKGRLGRTKQKVWTLKNKFITGQLMSLCWITMFYLAAGWKGVLLFVGQAAFAKFILETVNYLEHYGMTRDIKERVQPHHSWNSNKRMSGIVLFNLTRHSAHHEKGTLPFWELEPYEDAPTLPQGYLAMLFIAMIPPLWFSMMNPKVEEWKAKYAS